MPNVTVKARVASTRRMEKYGGVQLDVRVLHQMATSLNAGALPMNFGHSVLDPIQVSNVRAQVIELDDSEHAVEATFDVDEGAWAAVDDRFKTAGVPGGFSFTAGELQHGPPDDLPVAVSLSADAAAFTDEDREQAWRELQAIGPAQVQRLYQFDAVEIFRVIVEVWPAAIAAPILLNLASSAIYDALKPLVSRHRDPTVVEIHEHRADGSTSKAVIRTNDPDMLHEALSAFASEERPQLSEFDDRTRGWLPPGPPTPHDDAG